MTLGGHRDFLHREGLVSFSACERKTQMSPLSSVLCVRGERPNNDRIAGRAVQALPASIAAMAFTAARLADAVV